MAWRAQAKRSARSNVRNGWKPDASRLHSTHVILGHLVSKSLRRMGDYRIAGTCDWLRHERRRIGVAWSGCGRSERRRLAGCCRVYLLTSHTMALANARSQARLLVSALGRKRTLR